MAKKSKSKENTKKPEVIEVPSKEVFASNLVDAFLKENGMEMSLEEDETPINIMITIPELNARFSVWLCDLIREMSFVEVGSPNDKNLH